jgi:hypothetical protein
MPIKSDFALGDSEVAFAKRILPSVMGIIASWRGMRQSGLAARHAEAMACAAESACAPDRFCTRQM